MYRVLLFLIKAVGFFIGDVRALKLFCFFAYYLGYHVAGVRWIQTASPTEWKAMRFYYYSTVIGSGTVTVLLLMLWKGVFLKATFNEIVSGFALSVAAINVVAVALVSILRGSVDFPGMWYLLKFLMSSKTRDRVFLPAYYDLMNDYLETLELRGQSAGARWWLRFCFGFRTFIMVLDCVRVATMDRLVAVLLLLLPFGAKQWLREFWFYIFRS